LITSQDLNKELIRVSSELRAANDRLSLAGRDWAQAEYDYRLAKAKAYAQVRESNVKLIAPEKEALADSFAAEAQRVRNIADSERNAAGLAVRSLIGQLSALQSIAASVRSEMDLAGRDYS
jgi:hypothetical protein